MRENFKMIFLLFLLIIFFFLFRLINLTIIPVFCDEAIYIRWAQVMRAEPTLRFLPLSDGKQPLFMWLTIPFLKIFSDPLFAGRFLSILSGLGSLVGIFLLSLKLLKDKRVALISSLFYVIVPFFVFSDRLALIDSLLMMLGIWSFYLGTLLIRFLRLDLAMITGMVLGAALITKSPAIFFAILLPSTVLLCNKKIHLRHEKANFVGSRGWPVSAESGFTGRHLFKIVVLFLVVYVFAFGIYNLLRLGPNFNMIAIRNKDFVYSFRETLSRPLDPLRPHLRDLIEWLPNLFTLPIFFLALAGLVWLWVKQKKWREANFLFIMTSVPLLVESIFAKGLTPRYILFATWPLIILAAYCFIVLIDKFKTRKSFVILFIFLVLLPAFRYDWLLLYNPEKAPLPRNMRSGHLEEWTAGQGIKEIAEFVKEKAINTNVLVGTEGFFGTLPDGLQIYLEKVPHVTIIGVGYPILEVPKSLINSLVDNEVYLVVNQSRLLISPQKQGLKLIREYPKAVNPEGKQDKLLFFEVEKEFWQKK